MAITSAQVTVASTATLVVGGDPDWQEAQVKNIGAADVYLGDSGVLTTTGYKLGVGETINVRLNGAEKLYGVVATGTQPVSVLLKQVG